MAPMPNISLSKNQLLMIGGALALIVVVVVAFLFFGSKKPAGSPVTLTVWGIDPPEAFADAIKGYQTLRPNVTVKYVKIAAEGYDDAVLKALASGKGPDVFLIGNHDLLSRIELLAPAAATQATADKIQATFPQAAVQDFTYGNAVYAVPLYMDTLALLYNKQIFDQAGIATPPVTWQDVLDDVPRVRAEDLNGQITRAAIAIGGSEKSVTHGTDILNMIMLQNGASLSDEKGQPSFGRGTSVPTAFQFYLQFADAGNPAYTWNDVMQDSLESFVAQKVAMAFAYQGDLASIRTQAPFLDFGVAPAPQVTADNAVNYPSYRGLAVWSGSKVSAWGWDFALFVSTNSASMGTYLKVTGRPAALRSLLASQQKDPNLAVFAKAALTARSWKVGDYDKIKTIFSNAIQNVQTGAKTATEALGDAEAQANQLVSK